MVNDGWETCPTCGGGGRLRQRRPPNPRPGVTQSEYVWNPCPDCVDGMIPGPELVERVATILADHDTMDWQDDPDIYLPLAKAVLLATRKSA